MSASSWTDDRVTQDPAVARAMYTHTHTQEIEMQMEMI